MIKISNNTKAGLIGNVIEVYDMSIYGFLAPILAINFFPQHNHHHALIQTFGVFFLGFLARPIGAILYGHIGDRYGRKTALITSIMLMAIATGGLGLLPTYHNIGFYAAALLLLLRLFQGLSVGGEYLGSVVFLVEHSPIKRRGWYGALGQTSGTVGTMLAGVVCWLLTVYLQKTTLSEWAWRIPFLLAFLAGSIGLYIRTRADETKAFCHDTTVRQQQQKPPFIETLLRHKQGVLLIIFLTWLGVLSSYLATIYITTYLSVTLHYSMKDALLINNIGLVWLLFWMPFAGYLSDRFGRKLLLQIGTIGMMIGIFPYYYFLGLHSFTIALISQLAFTVPLGIYNSVALTVIVEAVPTHVRFSASTFGYNVGAALFGGTTPLIAMWMIHHFHAPDAPAYYLIAVGLLTAIVVLKIRETAGKPLRHTD